MLRFDFVSLFPELISAGMQSSILGRAVREGLIEFGTVNPRDFADDDRRTVDDQPYGGGAGMILLAPVMIAAIRSVRRDGSRVVAMDPSGKRFDQACATNLSKSQHIVLISGHYSGMDHRIFGECTEVVSLGDYILTGGELPSLVVADAVSRLREGVIGDMSNLSDDALSNGLLGFPQYTRPVDVCGIEVPEPLLSGDHGAIAHWRRGQSLRLTRSCRPDLFAMAPLEKSDLDLL